MRTLVIGLGNPLLTDDRVGLEVACRLRERLAARGDVTVEEDYRGGLQLMERMIGYDRGIVVDAIRSGAAAGTVHRLAPDDLPSQHAASAHDVNLTTALGLGRRMGLRLPGPDDVMLVAVEAADVTSFGEACTPPVASAIPRAVDAVLSALERDGGDGHGFTRDAAPLPLLHRRRRRNATRHRHGQRRGALPRGPTPYRRR